MPEAVIVSAARSPIGRANKGSLVEMRPDDLAALAGDFSENLGRLAQQSPGGRQQGKK